jgi:regulator of protease activity HflC (stomatin/prohibitin superfamily)
MNMNYSTKQLSSIVAGVFLLFATLYVGFNTWENLDASHIMVVQSPFSGKLTWYTSAGMKWQGFGKITEYKKRHQFEFECSKDKEGDTGGLPTTFNDGGKGSICGSIAWEMPLDTANLNLLHSKYGSDAAIESQIIRTGVEKAITMTGPLLSSTESYSARRNELLSLTLDQISHGVYRTDVREEKIKDEMTGSDKTVKVVNLRPSQNVNDHGFQRQEPSPLDEFKLHAFNLTIKDIDYEGKVVEQIRQQQQSIMQVQTAIAQSKQAEQQAITAAKNGEAEAAKAKWAQEVEKATEVTKAEQEKEVAALDVQTAQLRKQENILLGEGEAAKRRLAMQADGALDRKLTAWVQVQTAYADAIAKYQGNWVPGVVFGGDGKSSQGPSALIDLLTAKTARDIGLDLRNMSGDTSKK